MPDSAYNLLEVGSNGLTFKPYPKCCPVCQSENVNGYEGAVCEIDYWFVPTVCDDCKAEWNEILVVVGISDVVKKEKS
jgi:hypothetical protein